MVVHGEERFLDRLFVTKIYILPVIIVIIGMFMSKRGKRFSKKPKLTYAEIKTLN